MLSQALRKAIEIQQALQSAGMYVSRHATSMLVMYQGRLLATIHVYQEECKVNIYKPWLQENAKAIPLLLETVRRSCGRLVEGQSPHTLPLNS